MRIAEEENIEAINIFASFEDAVQYAKEIEDKVDAILSRGGTAAYIKRAVDIPVISIPISPFDLIKVIHDLDESVKEVAFFHFDNMIYNIDDIEEMYSIKICQYIFKQGEDIQQGVKDAKEKGIQIIIGGDYTARYAKSLGLIGIQISAGEEAVYRAFHETLQILDEKKKEKNRSAQLQVAFGAITEGVIVSNEEQKIVMCNSAARKILGTQKGNLELLEREIADIPYKNVFLYKEEEINYIRKIRESHIAVSHRPIFVDKKFVGVVSTFEDVSKIQKLETKIRHEMHAKGLIAKYHFSDIITEDSEMISIKKMSEVVAKTEANVLIEGESGTGKELFSQSIHNASNRSQGPFVAVNCAAIPENLLESELFGYESGAFTGAKKEGKAGLFEVAHNGTIFLDEIGELPMILQSRLLRVLQEKEIMRVGGNKLIPVDVRVISATNRDLKQKVKENAFREDLYYRLNVINIKIPPLRNRKADIELLAREYIVRSGFQISQELFYDSLKVFNKYNWPGNIRELHNILERIGVLCGIDDVSARNQLKQLENANLSEREIATGAGYTVNIEIEGGLKQTIEEVEHQIIKKMLEENGNNQDIVAEKLKIGKTTLWRKMKE